MGVGGGARGPLAGDVNAAANQVRSEEGKEVDATRASATQSRDDATSGTDPPFLSRRATHDSRGRQRTTIGWWREEEETRSAMGRFGWFGGEEENEDDSTHSGRTARELGGGGGVGGLAAGFLLSSETVRMR